jgi:hypothetical protein
LREKVQGRPRKRTAFDIFYFCFLTGMSAFWRLIR